MAGRKVFTSGEILTAADVNSYLMDQVVAVFADSSARSSAIPTPTEGMVTYVEDANRVEVYDGAAFGPIGGILQVVQTVQDNALSISTSGFTAISGLSVSITPSSTDSKVLIIANVNFGGSEDNGLTFLRLSGGNTSSFRGNASGSDAVAARGFRGANTATREVRSQILESATMVYLDSPSTISSVTYGVEMLASGVGYVNREGGTASVVGASSITAVEVAV